MLPYFPMPSLFRLLFAAALIAGSVWLVMWMLATFGTPSPREFTVKVPIEQRTP